jgi:hypothetical protein
MAPRLLGRVLESDGGKTMARKSKRQLRSKRPAKLGDLPAMTGGTRSTRGGSTIASVRPRTAAYQHNQTDLEFVR